MNTRVIVCGGRDFNNRELCFESLDRYLKGHENIEIVSGHARGADALAEEYAKAHGLKLTIFKADWKQYGKSAGAIRNRQMLQYASKEAPLVIAFWDGKSKGTRNMIDQAIEKVITRIVRY